MQSTHWRGFTRLGLLALAVSLSAAADPPLTIGVVLDGRSERNEALVPIFQSEMRELLRGQYDVRFPADAIRSAEWSAEGAAEAMDHLLADPQVDFVLTLGLLASAEALERRDLPNPVIAPYVVDPELQGAPRSGAGSGVSNLVYISAPNPITADLDAFSGMLSFDHLVFMADAQFLRTWPRLEENLAAAAAERGIQESIVHVDGGAADALDALPEDADAVYVGALLRLSNAEVRALADGLVSRELPAFAYWGREDVERGMLAASVPGKRDERLARRAALHVQRILDGAAPEELPVIFAEGGRLFLNMATARALGYSPTWDTLAEAELINEETDQGPRLDLARAVRDALEANLQLDIARADAAAGRHDVAAAESKLRPQVDAEAVGLVIDEDRAAASMGQQPERELTASLTARQLVYSDKALGNVTIQQRLQDRRLNEAETARLDVIQEAAKAYLNVLRAQTFERIQRDNLRLTRSNLDIARVRRDVGAAGPEEVYRWESKLATNRREFLAAQAQREAAEIAVNRVRHRPLEEPFTTVDPGLENPELVDVERLAEYLDNPRSFAAFRDFLVREGLERAPELAALDAALEAQSRAVTVARRAFTHPELGLEASVTQHLAEAGAGAEGFRLGGGLGSTLSSLIDLPQPDDTDWRAGLAGSLPLYAGGARSAALRKARAELDRLALRRLAAREQLEQAIRSAAHAAQASYAGIEEAQLASEAAGKNLELVKDAYSRGVVSIVKLLDAQNAALVADQAAANAVFDFLLDLMDVERSVSRFTFFMSDEDREAFFTRLQEYLEVGNAAD